MARKARYEYTSESNVYHVTARGSGRRALFEDDADRLEYLQALFECVDESSGSLAAWCLMDNHVHLLFHLELRELSKLIQRLHTRYGQHFNGRHGHVGHVFQGRFDCVPVQTDAQIVEVVRYIHRNPKDSDSGNWRSYPWSSYAGYLDGITHCETEMIVEIFGGPSEFIRLHETADNMHMVRLDGYRKKLSDTEARKILESRLGPQFADMLASLPKDKRNRELVTAYNMGLSVRQIERLTGIGRNIISRVVSKS